MVVKAWLGHGVPPKRDVQDGHTDCALQMAGVHAVEAAYTHTHTHTHASRAAAHDIVRDGRPAPVRRCDGAIRTPTNGPATDRGDDATQAQGRPGMARRSVPPAGAGRWRLQGKGPQCVRCGPRDDAAGPGVLRPRPVEPRGAGAVYVPPLRKGLVRLSIARVALCAGHRGARLAPGPSGRAARGVRLGPRRGQAHRELAAVRAHRRSGRRGAGLLLLPGWRCVPRLCCPFWRYFDALAALGRYADSAHRPKLTRGTTFLSLPVHLLFLMCAPACATHESVIITLSSRLLSLLLRQSSPFIFYALFLIFFSPRCNRPWDLVAVVVIGLADRFFVFLAHVLRCFAKSPGPLTLGVGKGRERAIDRITTLSFCSFRSLRQPCPS